MGVVMKRTITVTAVWIALILPFAGCKPRVVSPLYPPIEPLRSGFLQVSDVHEIYWEVCGNPEGLPVIVLHGGPGGTAGPRMRRFFDPERFYVLLFDQRGAIRSRPVAEWRDNTTQLLIEDINRLREHVGIDRKAILFGGSWGTTLALAYAETYPEHVGGMVLRGVFLATQQEIDGFYHGGTAVLFPDNWERLRKILPEPESYTYPRQLFDMATGDDAIARKKAIEGWAYYELRMASIYMTDESTEEMIRELSDYLMPFAVLENYYMMNNCFLDEGQILRDVARIAHIPTFIVHGRFDAICQPRSAYQLAGQLQRVKLELPAAAGHLRDEPPTTEALVRGVRWVADQLQGSDER
jgi:proline iminopeptidase